jgi:hypothetical protein
MLRIRKLALSTVAIVAALASADIASAQSRQTSPGGWAIVAPDGTLGHNANVKSVKHVSTGVYLVKFNQDVSTCAANATIAGRGKKSITPGYIVVSRAHTSDVIKVNTFLTVTLLPADFRFDVMVMC